MKEIGKGNRFERDMKGKGLTLQKKGRGWEKKREKDKEREKIGKGEKR